jgi:hypothetical protein
MRIAGAPISWGCVRGPRMSAFELIAIGRCGVDLYPQQIGRLGRAPDMPATGEVLRMLGEA